MHIPLAGSSTCISAWLSHGTTISTWIAFKTFFFQRQKGHLFGWWDKLEDIWQILESEQIHTLQFMISSLHRLKPCLSLWAYLASLWFVLQLSAHYRVLKTLCHLLLGQTNCNFGRGIKIKSFDRQKLPQCVEVSLPRSKPWYYFQKPEKLRIEGDFSHTFALQVNFPCTSAKPHWSHRRKAL